jgi:exopolysaccharide transport family protein
MRNEGAVIDGLAKRADAGRWSASKAIDFSALIDVFRRRWKLLAGVTLLVFAAVIAATLLITPMYEATTRIKIDPKPNSPVEVGANKSSGLPDQAVVDTEVSIMRSRDLAEAVATKLQLHKDPEFAPKPGTLATLLGSSASGPPLTPADVAGDLLGRLTVGRERTTYVVNVTFRATDSKKSALIANEFANQYIASNLGNLVGTAARRSAWLDQRLATLGAQVRAADAQVAQYRAQAGIVEGGTSGTITDQQVAPLSTQLATAESNAAAARASLAAARSQIAQGGLDAVSGVLNSGVVADLRRQRAEVGREQADIFARYGPRHPASIRVAQQLDGLDRQIKEESQRIVAGLEADARAATARANSLQAELQRLTGQQANNTRASVIAESLEREAEAKRTIYNQLAQAAQEADQVQRASESSGRVIELARPPSVPTFPNKPFFAMLGLVLGVVTGAAVVLLAETLSTGIRTVEDVETGLGSVHLASVPQVPERQLSSGESGPLTPWQFVVAKPMSAYAEAFRSARNALLLSRPDDRPRIIAIASAVPKEGKTTCAASLARVMAMSGDRVILIDCDLRRNGLRDVVAPSGKGGLLEVLDGRTTVDEAIVTDVETGLDVLPLEKPMFTPQDVFGGGAMRDLLTTLSARYDYVVMDTPPLLGVADARTLATLSDFVLLVIRWNQTPKKAVRTAMAWLELDQTPVSGVMLSMVDQRAEAMGVAYYSTAYGGYYQE